MEKRISLTRVEAPTEELKFGEELHMIYAWLYLEMT